MSRILLGANYYPEDWDIENIDSDIEKMKECGFNVVRIAEFAWKKMQPDEDTYNFEWLHYVVDKMKAANISVILGTPTATPPSWLIKKHPDMATLSANGVRTSHGGRRHCCSSNPNYKRYSTEIVERMAKEFGNDENIIGWQIDNEIYPFGDGCCCDFCKSEFHLHLREKYGNAESINRAWNLNLFSQAYDEIDDIPIPVNAWHNPHIKLEWKLSQAKNHIKFIHMQADIIKKYSNAPIGTDTMPLGAIDYRVMNSPLDVAQFNHYDTDLEYVCMWMDYMRNFSKLPFWNTETQACWNGSTCPGHALLGEGFIYMNTWLPIMLGGEANLYWLWRTHWAGHELMHGAVIDSAGRFTHANCEIRHAAKEFEKIRDFIGDYKVCSDTALLFTSLNWCIKESQDISNNIPNSTGYVSQFYKHLIHSGIHPDVVDSKLNLDSYKLIFTPSAYTLEENNLSQRLCEWVKNGGVWVAGPLCDIRTNIGTKYKDSPYGVIETLTGERCAYTLPHDNGLITLENELLENISGRDVYELFDDGDFESILKVTKGHSAIIEKHVSFVKKVGKGYFVMLGTIPDECEMHRIIKKCAALAGAEQYLTDGNILVTKRACDNDIIYIAASVNGVGGTLYLEGKYTDILSGRVFDGKVELLEFEVLMLKKTT